ncbi:hypothetical protein LYSHEL_09530 [Lysobacter helvus]|uniref:ArsR family transcriptional regulator n=2 Tax=Lysobacteraceae TaxID=32033 RepID=A0ABN6FRA3_9GAMM|nr:MULTISPECIES: hypothetical protein [Lysobacter]BCT91929.1 hypothetical protein LYSCAS_09530 [Lysobacter caseinilyticus]BCT95082.1 hypothetical protein LYSHEL_09530 [Lysobacter helvus]
MTQLPGHFCSPKKKVNAVLVTLLPGDREELRKLTESLVVRHPVDEHIMARLGEQGLVRRVYGGWEITDAGWHALERTRIPAALT